MPTSDIKKGPLYVDSTNNRVGIKTVAPDLALHVEGTNAAPASSGSTPTGFVSLRQKDGGSSHGANIGVLGVPPWGTWIQGQDANNLATSYPLLLNPNGGSVGIGTTSMVRTLEITDGTSGKIRAKGTDGGFIECHNGTNGVYFGTAPAVLGSGSGGDSVIFTDSGFNQLYYTSGVERLRLDSSGNFQVSSNGTVNTTGTNSGMNISAVYGTFQTNQHGNDYPIINIHTSGANNRFFDFRWGNTSVGNISTNGSTTSYNTSSDYRLKTAVTYDWDATTRLKQLNPVRFNFIADPDTTVDGFRANEGQDIVPEAVTGTHNEVDDEGNPVYQGIDQSKLTPLLTKALIEAVEKIEQLEARIAALEAN